MPTPRRSKTATKPQKGTLLNQIASHVFKNRLTTFLGLSVGIPVIVQGYTEKDWNAIGQGFTDVALGISGDDRFGIKAKPAVDPTQPPFE